MHPVYFTVYVCIRYSLYRRVAPGPWNSKPQDFPVQPRCSARISPRIGFSSEFLPRTYRRRNYSIAHISKFFLGSKPATWLTAEVALRASAVRVSTTPIVSRADDTLGTENWSIRLTKKMNGSQSLLTLGTEQGKYAGKCWSRKAIRGQSTCSVCRIGIHKKCKDTSKDKDGSNEKKQSENLRRFT